MVTPAARIKTLKEYLAAAKLDSSAMTCASGGTGSLTQLLGAKVNLIAGTRVQEVAYKAIGAEIPDLLGGHVKAAYLAPVVVAELIKSGRFVAIAVAGASRIPLLPDVPTFAEAGLAGVEAYGWNGLFVPRGTPPDVIRKLQTDVAQVMSSDAFKADAHDMGYELGNGKAGEFAAYVKSEASKWNDVVKAANIKVE